MLLYTLKILQYMLLRYLRCIWPSLWALDVIVFSYTKQSKRLWNTAFKKIEFTFSVKIDHVIGNFLKAVFHKFFLIHSRIPWLLMLRFFNNMFYFLCEKYWENVGCNILRLFPFDILFNCLYKHPPFRK